jgi:hypothetical protein
LQVVAKAKQVVPKSFRPSWNGFEGRVGRRRTRPSRVKAEAVDEGAGHVQSMGTPGSLRTTCREGADNESPEPLVGRLGLVGTAKALRISRSAAKSRCAGEWGGWGRLSDDGPRQNNSDRSEGPWGKAASAACTEVHQRTAFLGSDRGYNVKGSEVHEGRMQTARCEELVIDRKARLIYRP